MTAQQPRRARLWLRSATLVLLTMLAMPTRAAADDAGALLERRIKAALLYRFSNYVEWPESAFPHPHAPFTIGVAGANTLAAELTAFAAGKQVFNRLLAVRRRIGVDSFSDAQIIFIGRDAHAELGAIIRAAPPNALIVTESENALEQGSVINFVVVAGQVRFEISLEAAQRRNLRLSSRLLSVAHAVHTGAP